MNDDQIAKITHNAMGVALARIPTMEDKKSALGMFLITSYRLLRTAKGDEFVRGFLEGALQEVSANPPDTSIVRMH
ncbi:hypothetical protein [Rhodoferax sp.]|uniref:hypothetical protein n=1 Tax=Rhodoferax sp. TaxID=50421 RepID=UPI00262370CB|nr:hypothetical protein [Rhodoferax sp.]MDD2920230.1 hypothetical protein [Rhodoferax sp.]